MSEDKRTGQQRFRHEETQGDDAEDGGAYAPPRALAAQRIACVDLPDLGLQYATQQRGIDKDVPHVWVEASGPSLVVQASNVAARRQGVMAGMRIAQARSICAELVVSAIESSALRSLRQDIGRQLRRFSPWVERHPLWPDSFWVRGDGLHRLWTSATAWGESIHSALALKGFKASVIVGFSRFYALALARQNPGHLRVFRTPEQARAQALKVPLSFLLSDPKLWEEFRTLGLHTLGDLRTLPPSAVHRRYGKEAAQWLTWVHAMQDIPSHALKDPVVYETQVAWDVPITSSTTLLFVLTQPLEQLLQEVARAGRVCAALRWELTFDWGRYVDDRLRARAKAAGVEPKGRYAFVLRASTAHVDAHRWVELLRLRLSRLTLPLGVLSVHCTAEDVPAQVHQERWEGVQTRRRPEALLQGLAQVRAELSDDAVGRLVCTDAHLPEVRNRWTQCTTLDVPVPHPRWTPVMMRRMAFDARELLGPTTEGALQAWFAQQSRRCHALMGPYIVAGGWWVRDVERAYYYAFLDNGEVHWLYYDRVRRRWFLQGKLY